MKHLLTTVILSLTLLTAFTACEKTDYQHPGHRSK